MRRYISIASILTALVLEPAAAQDNWPQWCGPLANGKMYVIGGGTIAGLRASNTVEEYVP